MIKTRVVLVEDDLELSAAVQQFLEKEGLEVRAERTGEAAVARVQRTPPDVVLLDLMLPGRMSGLEACSIMRATYDGGIIMLTARGQDSDQVAGLEVGADDYVVKPVRPRVLLARIHSVLRRNRRLRVRGNRVIEVGALRLQPEARSAYFGDERLRLTTGEYDLLLYLARRAGRVVTRAEIYRDLRGIGYDGAARWLDILVSRVRRKLGQPDDTVIATVRGSGYMLVLPADSGAPGASSAP